MPFKRGLGAVLTSALAASGALVVTSAPAEAARLTDYGFNGWAYGTRVSVNPLGLKVGQTAYTVLGCTRQAGKLKTGQIATVDGGDNAPIKIGTAQTRLRTYKNADGQAGLRSTSEIAEIVIGNSSIGNISIEGLQTIAHAYADPDGNLHAESEFLSADISANLLPVLEQFPELEPILGPLQDLLNTVGATVGDLIQTIIDATGNEIVIPGVAVLRLGHTWNKVRAQSAHSAASSLRVFLPGTDGQVNTDDDVEITVGRSRADIAKDVPVGLMSGRTHAVEATLLDGTAQLGPLGSHYMKCEGTRGEVLHKDLLGANLLGLDVVDAGAGHSKLYGAFKENGFRKAWAESTLADITLGTGDASLHIEGIVARATAIQQADGDIKLRSWGSQVAVITAGGESYPIPDPGQALEIPGLATIEAMVTERGKRSIRVTAVRVTLFDGTEAKSVVNIGHAKASIYPTSE